jgi:MscS family membrane protein
VAIQNLGYSVSGLLAGLGIGGLAMALAAKDTLASIFAAITLLVDRPFKVGDWVRSPDFEGIVEEIGFRSTRIRTFDRTLTVVPNNRLMDAVIDNQQAMTARRIVLTLALAPATPAALLRQALEEVRRIVAGVEGLSAADQTVRLQNLTPTSVDILVRAFTPATDDATHGAIRQELLLRIVEALERLEVQFAAPAPAPAPPQAATRRS